MQTESIFIIHPATSEQVNALKAFVKALKIKFEIAKETPYDPEFVAKIERGREDYRKGKGIEITMDELKALCK